MRRPWPSMTLRTNSGTRALLPMEVSMRRTASLAPPWSGPERGAEAAARHVEDEERVEGPFEHRVRCIAWLHAFPEHGEEVRGKREVVVWIYVEEPLGVTVGIGSQRRDLCDAAADLEVSDRRVRALPLVGLKGSEGREAADKHRHGV